MIYFTSFAIFVYTSVSAAAVTPASKPIQYHRTPEFQKALKFAQNINISPLWLENFLIPFAIKQCYVILRNFFNLDFAQITVPLLAVYFEPRLPNLNGQSDMRTNKFVIWVAKKFQSSNYLNEALGNLQNQNCDSRYFINGQITENSYWGFVYL